MGELSDGSRGSWVLNDICVVMTIRGYV